MEEEKKTEGGKGRGRADGEIDKGKRGRADGGKGRGRDRLTGVKMRNRDGAREVGRDRKKERTEVRIKKERKDGRGC